MDGLPNKHVVLYYAGNLTLAQRWWGYLNLEPSYCETTPQHQFAVSYYYLILV